MFLQVRPSADALYPSEIFPWSKYLTGGQDKAPGAMAKGMSWLVTNAKMALGDDTTAAYLVADGCDMGVKSLCRSRNRYPAAEKDAKQIAESLIDCEEELSASMRPFL